MYYVYENHLGGYFISLYELDFEETYCDTCGDSDWLAYTCETIEEAHEFIGSCFDEYDDTEDD